MTEEKNIETKTTEPTVQATNDELEMLNLIASVLNDQSEAIDGVNKQINTVGRESLELHKVGENTNALLDNHAAFLDKLVKSQEVLEKNNENAAKIIDSTRSIADKVQKSVLDLHDDSSKKIDKLNKDHEETIKTLNTLSSNNDQSVTQLMMTLGNTRKDIAKLDHKKDIDDVHKTLSDLVKALVDSDKQNQANEDKFNIEFDKVQKSLFDAISHTNSASKNTNKLADKMDNIDKRLDRIGLQVAAIYNSSDAKDTEKPKDKKETENNVKSKQNK